MRSTYIIIIAVAFVVLVAVLYGFSVIGSPLETRNMQFDETRVTNLLNLKTGVQEYYSTNNQLPATLGDLQSYYASNTKDPETQTEYEYSAGATSYQLCATFSLDSDAVKKRCGDNSYGCGITMAYDYDNTFKHTSGHQCFSFDVPTVNAPLTIPPPSLVPQ